MLGRCDGGVSSRGTGRPDSSIQSVIAKCMDEHVTVVITNNLNNGVGFWSEKFTFAISHKGVDSSVNVERIN